MRRVRPAESGPGEGAVVGLGAPTAGREDDGHEDHGAHEDIGGNDAGRWAVEPRDARSVTHGLYLGNDRRPAPPVGRGLRSARWRRAPTADIRLRPHRRHADRGAGRARRLHRLVLPAPVRQRERVCLPAGSGARGLLVDPPGGQVDLHPALPPAHQHPRDHVPHRRRWDRECHRLHAGGRGRPALGRASRDPPAPALHPRPGHA